MLLASGIRLPEYLDARHVPLETVEVIETKEALHLEPGVVVDDALVAEVKFALQACAAWHRTPQVVVRYATEPGLARWLSD